MDIVVGCNESGKRVGEDHPNAKLTDHEVDLILEMRDEGFSYGEIAKMFEVSKSQVRNIITGLKRCQIPVRFKTVHLSDK